MNTYARVSTCMEDIWKNSILLLYNYILRALHVMIHFSLCVCVIPSYISVSHAKKHKKRNLTIDLFSLYVLFSQIREFAFWLSLIMHTYARGCTCTDDIRKKQFSGVPSRGLKWKDIQNIQAKKIYSYVLPLILVK